MDSGNISFIVPVKNAEATIQLCLESIINEMIDGDQLIVIDNGSTDKTIDIAKCYLDIVLLEKPGISVGKLRNEGARVASGVILGFIDADCVIGAGWRRQIFHSIAPPNIAATGSKYSLPQRSHWIERAWFSQTQRESGEVNYINSGNLAVKRDVFFKVGGFDESLITGEDAELCLRLKSKGYLVWEDPAIKAVHLGNPKSLSSFYKKQRWHGLGMFGTFRVSWLDKPLIMTLGFALCWLVAVLMMFALIVLDRNHLVWVSVPFIFLVPGVTAIFRCFQYRQYTFFPQYVVLYTLYYCARTEALFKIVLKRVG